MIFQIFGNINNPYSGTYQGGIRTGTFGLIFFLNNIVKLAFVVGGLIVFINLIVAGFQFMQSGGEAKNIESAWNKIWQSLIGLVIMVISFLLISLVSFILFGDPTQILKPDLFGPR
ncbi:hypothetical protein HY345_00650 [Candidatus Microgenomates bacterium]|nr:hypothetical protein [Candidatus Microgenomates bacterium]